MEMISVFLAENRYYLIAAAVIVLVVLLFVILRACRPLPKRIEDKIRRKKYISAEDFLEQWKNDKTDYPGCYVVLIYDKKLIFNPLNYDDIYVGQSVNVRKRVFSHICGRGNGNVYYGLKSGCRVYVVIQKCRRKKLNEEEINLIRYFRSTDSLNMTRGGAVKR